MTNRVDVEVIKKTTQARAEVTERPDYWVVQLQ